MSRYRTISLNDYVERFPQSLNILDNFSKSFKESAFDSYLPSKYEKLPKIEYVGKVPLNRDCGHGLPLDQIKIHAKNISIQCMDDLIDMGWRREGTNFYKTVSDCCNTYALRMNPSAHKISRQNRKILNRYADFFKYGENENRPAPSKVGAKKNKQPSTEDFTLDAYFKRIYESCEAHTFEVRTVKPGSKIFYETFEEAFALFHKYYAAIHKKNYNRDDFKSMMATSPLTMFGNEAQPQHFGTFHRQYLIDGKIVGVEMFDVLSKYMIAQASFYNPDLSHMNLGTFMILEHILYAQKTGETLGRTMHYSTSLYNHCFKKHHYKLNYADEILNNDKVPKWVPWDKNLLPLLDSETKIVSSPEPIVKLPKASAVPCSYSGKVHTFGTFQALLPEKEVEKFEKKLDEYISHVGDVAKKMIVYY